VLEVLGLGHLAQRMALKEVYLYLLQLLLPLLVVGLVQVDLLLVVQVVQVAEEVPEVMVDKTVLEALVLLGKVIQEVLVHHKVA
jgi:hypothetical protein